MTSKYGAVSSTTIRAVDWTAIGDLITSSPFTRDIDMCAANIPNGKLFLSIKVQDEAGKFSDGTQGLTELTKAVLTVRRSPRCAPPLKTRWRCTRLRISRAFARCSILASTPTWRRCHQFPRQYIFASRWDPAVSAVLYPETDFNGLLELFQNGDSDLSDNVIGAASAGSLRVLTRVVPPVPPTLTLPEVITNATDLTLQWDVANGEETSSQLTGPDNYSNSRDWQNSENWNVGKLARRNLYLDGVRP